MPKQKNTSWQRVAKWYDHLLEGEGTYQKELILPNLLRLMEIKKDEMILDLACGQGFFARVFAEEGARVTGVDSSPALLALAKTAAEKTPTENRPRFQTAKAENIPFIKSGSMDKVTIVLALQNIQNVAATVKEAARVLKTGGEFYIILNHPAFRIPKASSWGWDDAAKTQYRRIDQYLSELKVLIDMRPGARAAGKKAVETVSFHRPLQFYFKALNKAGLSVTMFEEWNSHRKSDPGPRADAEDRARKEIPLFLCLAGKKG